MNEQEILIPQPPTSIQAHEIANFMPARIAPLAAHMIEKVPPDLSRFLICTMPGLLVALHVKEGDVVEAMKMENILRAEKSATVKKVNAAPGESLAVDAIILELE
ncbi:hypothetical protein H7F51_11035 [Novosphingobium flavum]|uniref:Lipoyl-binding domain-containing protein n=1 Tax=Novosphingobium flavum TaxID=1778672 RepID=A0A7X1FS97_9SPHN|nr:hypothetical protein [Novosphingobium flavum]